MELRRLTREDFPLLSQWLAESLVARWWDDDASPEAVERQYGPTVDGDDPTAVDLGVHGGRPDRARAGLRVRRRTGVPGGAGGDLPGPARRSASTT